MRNSWVSADLKNYHYRDGLLPYFAIQLVGLTWSLLNLICWKAPSIAAGKNKKLNIRKIILENNILLQIILQFLVSTLFAKFFQALLLLSTQVEKWSFQQKSNHSELLNFVCSQANNFFSLQLQNVQKQLIIWILFFDLFRSEEFQKCWLFCWQLKSDLKILQYTSHINLTYIGIPIFY